MLPTATDNGARLAAILPTGIAAVAHGLGRDPRSSLDATMGATLNGGEPAGSASMLANLPQIRSLVMVVVDGLGYANLKARFGHAPTLARLPQRRIETVTPSTTGAALTTITTGRLPGAHGLVGYRIRHPQLGIVSTLKEWNGIEDRRSWQLATPLFAAVRDLGARPVAIGRPAHAEGGLTEAILTGADYQAGQHIEDRFAVTSTLVRGQDPVVVYLYIDELDKAAHDQGWQSGAWVRRLEQFDSALDGFMRGLPSGVGVVITADHGIVDVEPHQQILLDSDPERFKDVTEVGGEPRFRSLYLREGTDPKSVARQFQETERGRAWVATRDEAIASGAFGSVATGVADRLGDVIIAARKQVAYYCSHDDPRARAMVGQHGSLSEDERGVPLILGGALAGSGFANVVTEVARSRIPLPETV
ncbi:alkaline phosphatase family protein [Leucobacter coleopterorum]|uniref:Alkaline phosphatase family protein n=1 Tax=Leucobacter coleopterorum TaxID=2714933 RepID=A0ABX6JZW4_9MICO|nr:nucleotide pyrophosphatase/phosphodiesterase family protein [Leucobacter coleopterorum]QIM18484.1 alkaline phosphatase family protein [Leucobacter coleopterorum]